MNDRENKEFVTPSGRNVLLRTYLTGKESNALKAIMYGSLKINSSEAADGKVSLADIPAGFMIDQERKMLEFLVVSVDGDANNPVEILENLPEADYNAVVAEANKIRVPFKPEK